jgi:hypothetical protein
MIGPLRKVLSLGVDRDYANHATSRSMVFKTYPPWSGGEESVVFA